MSPFGKDEALRRSKETLDCSMCHRRTVHIVMNYYDRDTYACTECGTSYTIYFEGKEASGGKTRDKKKPTPPPKKMGRPRKEDEEE